MSRPLDVVVKEQLGDLVFQLCSAKTLIEQLQEKVLELSPPTPEKPATE